MILDHAQPLIVGEPGEQLVVAGGWQQFDGARSPLGLAGPRRHLPAGDDGEQLGAEADAENGDPGGQRLVDEGAFSRQERGALILIGEQSATEQHQPIDRRSLAGQPLGQVRSGHELRIDPLIGEPVEQAAGAAGRRVLDDDDPRRISHASCSL